MDTTACQCRKCYNPLHDQVHEFGVIISTSRFIVCGICGNKRCPHATDHDLECTNSNEPGQKGSYYE